MLRRLTPYCLVSGAARCTLARTITAAVVQTTAAAPASAHPLGHQAIIQILVVDRTSEMEPTLLLLDNHHRCVPR